MLDRDVAVVSRPPWVEPKGSKLEDFGLETEPTSANRESKVELQLSHINLVRAARQKRSSAQ